MRHQCLVVCGVDSRVGIGHGRGALVRRGVPVPPDDKSRLTCACRALAGLLFALSMGQGVWNYYSSGLPESMDPR